MKQAHLSPIINKLYTVPFCGDRVGLLRKSGRVVPPEHSARAAPPYTQRPNTQHAVIIGSASIGDFVGGGAVAAAATGCCTIALLTERLLRDVDDGVRRPSPPDTRPVGWPLQDVPLLRGWCARINHPFFPPAHLHRPPWCNTIARLLDSIRLPFRPPVCMLCTIQYW